MEALIIFPTQLFEHHTVLSKEKLLIIIKDPVFYSGIAGNLDICKRKINYHDSTIKKYSNFMAKNGYRVKIIECKEFKQKGQYSYCDFFIENKINLDRVYYYNIPDNNIENKFYKDFNNHGIRLTRLECPGYILKEDEARYLLGENRHYFFTSFYIKVRKKLDILFKDNKPEGGKWTFDNLNRKKLPAGLNINNIDINLGESFKYPDDFASARLWLDNFLENRLKYFGDYEDSIKKESNTLFHSVLSPVINIGLITPEYLINRTLEYAKTRTDILLNSLEGFIRQVIGWREFMRSVYITTGTKQKTSNYFNHKNKLPYSFYSAKTDIEPFDNTVNKVIKTSYCHHIERLMILGNFMLLCEIDPNSVYKWFMELFIDAYEWVMVPNVFGMSQYADGGLITTKPYFSSSNYILNMSDYKKNRWNYTWDSLFWRFISKNIKNLEKINRMQLVIANFNKLDKTKINRHINHAENYLAGLL